MDIGLIITFILYYFMIFCSVLWIIIFSRNYKTLHKDPKAKKSPDVTIIIPAYNEEKRIKKAIDSCFDSDYDGKVNVVVVNDGSTDRTREICESYGNKIKLINKENTGKASSINIALKKVNTDIVGVMDADSYFTKNAIKKMMGYFNYEEVGAVTPSMIADNEKNILQKIQWVEYVFSVYLRKLFSIVDAQYVCPGPGSLYRTKILREVGGFDENNLTEDMEIAFRLKEIGYAIENSVNAVVYTHIPEKIKPLVKQRIRWYAGYYENVKKYSHMLFNRDFGSFGTFLLPSNFIWIFAIVFILGYWGITFFNSFYQMILNLFSINLDVAPMIRAFELRFDWLVFDVTQVFNIMFLIVGALIIILSLKVAKEKPMIKNRFTHYGFYMLFYFSLLSVLYIAATIYFIIFSNRIDKSWKKGKLA